MQFLKELIISATYFDEPTNLLISTNSNVNLKGFIIIFCTQTFYMIRSVNKNICVIILFTSFAFSANAQVANFLNENPNFYNLSRRWELDSGNQRGTFLITPYRSVYILPGRWSSNPNKSPVSENPNYNYPFKVPLNKYEAKFQISFKTKILQNIFWNHGDLWIAYTQRSHWQIYNQKLSRPFRETNYEPEVILNFATDFNVLGFKARMAGLSFTHQSNGRAVPLSRSWNRVIGHIGFEKKNGQYFLEDGIA